MPTEPILANVLSVLPELPVSVQIAFCDRPEYHLYLACNEALAGEVWDKLWAKKSKSLELSTNLVRRTLSPERIAAVLAKEKRVTVLSAMLSYNTPSSLVEVEAYLTSCATTSFLPTLYAEVSDQPALADYVGERLEGLDRLEWLLDAEPPAPGDDLVAMIESMPEWFGNSRHFGRQSRLLKRLFESRPELLALCVHEGGDIQGTAVFQAAAGASTLIDEKLQWTIIGGNGAVSKYLQLALVANPRCAQVVLDHVRGITKDADVKAAIDRRRHLSRPIVSEPYDQLSDPALLAWIFSRATPRDGGEEWVRSPGRPYDLLALASNPYISQDMAESIAVAFTREDVFDALGAGRVTSGLEALRKLHPKLGKEFVDTTWVAIRAGFKVKPLSSSPFGQVFGTTPESIALVGAEKTCSVMQRSHLGLAVGRAILSRLGDDPHAWLLFSELATWSSTAPLGELADVCHKLSQAKQA